MARFTFKLPDIGEGIAEAIRSRVFTKFWKHGVRGGTGLATAWPTDDPGIGRDERRQLQTLLLARGHDIGSADGMIGTATRRAIQAEQQRLGWANADGRAGQRILRALQQEAAAGTPATR